MNDYIIQETITAIWGDYYGPGAEKREQIDTRMYGPYSENAVEQVTQRLRKNRKDLTSSFKITGAFKSLGLNEPSISGKDELGEFEYKPTSLDFDYQAFPLR